MRGRALSQSPHSCDNRNCLAAEAEAQEVTGAFLHSSTERLQPACPKRLLLLVCLTGEAPRLIDLVQAELIVRKSTEHLKIR